MKKTLFVLCLTALLGISPASAQVDFTRYVALGDSLTAGVASGSLHMDYQQTSYPALLAQAAGAPVFEMPLISDPGIPHIWELVSLQGPAFDTYPDGPIGLPINAEYPYPYNNLGVPGANLYDLLFTTGDITNLLQDPPIMDNAEHDLVLRIPQVPDPNTGELVDLTALAAAIGQDPTFITLWIGNNDILGAAVYGTPIEGVTMRPLEGDFGFASLFQQALGALATMTTADIVVVTLPYATDAPIISTVPPFIQLPDGSVVPIIGTNGPLTADSYVTLPGASWLAQYYDPLNGVFLPEDIDPATGAPGYVLRPEEVEIINGRIDDYNAVIEATAAAFGIPVLNFNELLHDLTTGEGEPIAFGGWEPDAGFLTGGIFSYDGVHPQQIGQGIVAMELIDLINAEFGASIPQIDMSELMCPGGCHSQVPFDPDKTWEVYTMEASEALLRFFPLLSDPSTSLDQGAYSD